MNPTSRMGPAAEFKLGFAGAIWKDRDRRQGCRFRSEQLASAAKRGVRPSRGVALTHKGRWPKHEPQRANVNLLNPGRKADMGESSCVHRLEVTIVPKRGDVLA
jgi:hypothetical protein